MQHLHNPIRAEQAQALDAADVADAKERAVVHYGREAAQAELSALRQRVDTLRAELAEFKGIGARAQEGCFIKPMCLGEATVLVEFEHTPASGDGHNEPREEESIEALQVLVNGQWIDVEAYVPKAVADRWVEDAFQMRADDAEAAAEAAAEARAEDRRVFA